LDYNINLKSVNLLVYVTYIKEASVAASKETGLEVNDDVIMYMVMSRDQNAGLFTM
jgi:hypothetical protein